MRYSPADRSMVIRPFAANGRSREAETRASDIARSAGPATNAITTAAVTIVRICDHYENRIRSVPPELRLYHGVVMSGSALTPSHENGSSWLATLPRTKRMNTKAAKVAKGAAVAAGDGRPAQPADRHRRFN